MPRALLIIDMQRFVTDSIQQGMGYYPATCIENMTRVLEQFRTTGATVIHVRHESAAGTPMQPGAPLAMPMEAFDALPEEPVFIKNTSSAFSSTALLPYLQSKQIAEVVVIGAVAGFCVNSTVRMGSDLGLNMVVVNDAVISFELQPANLTAKEIFDVTLALLGTSFARSISTEAFLKESQ
ncbi:isochorismatase family protein [Dickeya solani]|uniref:Isochorismatase hydrolase n=1 Tax=Dickeya solani D s0432-1 TaxID=1231725 RepID=A0AAV3KDN9_9GAMM|nr:isochorismatase family protein [Dickeya solani]ANE77442.1 hypothetical protein A4U42_20075 [Dickeya solani IPO 2222]AUC40739.1 Isochorismatase [Dickeya solani RNS 08.23.3.1.A]AUH07149.1 hypothetical protein BJD21_00970 [Dickeya solani D s0432-1]AUH11198.1 hypothetical protein BJJ98_00930 [Dickeya solani]AYQ48044.1 Streptothricin hydrolase [Dickeya solani]